MKMSNEEAFKKSLQTLFRGNLEQSKLKLALLKENFEYQDFFSNFTEWDKNSIEGAWPGLGFNKFGLMGLRFYIFHPFYQYDKIMDLINPQKDLNILPGKYINLLPRLFYDPAVELIEVGKISHHEGGTSKPIWVVNERGLKPCERIYKVDLSKKKTQIMKEFEGYIDRAYLTNTEESNWIPNKKRDRKEAWAHLEVWKLRKKRINFPEIAKALNITAEAAKKSYYRACELTQWKRYDPELKKEIWCVKIADIQKTCDICPEREECKELCPDALRYVEQDNIQLREKILPEDSDSLRDYLIQNSFKNYNSPENKRTFLFSLFLFMKENHNGGYIMKEKRDINDLLSDLEKVLPPVVFRNWKRWCDYIPISPRTLANEDCLHTGPSERVMVGRVIGYPKAALMDWLRARSKVV